jgi:2-C-methyl-D-erythritol 4-phosphate cytidylyltransferase
MKTSVIIVAAGSGKRMNSKIAKQFIELKGRPILSYTIESFAKSEYISEIIIVTGKDDISFVETEIAEPYGKSKVKAVVQGGSERQYSVQNGLNAVSDDIDIIMVHDGVRPFIDNTCIKNLIDCADKFGGCVLGVPVKDTIKICDGENTITATPERKTLWAAQTPQCFKAEIIKNAYKSAFDDGFLGTDDASLAERIGIKLKMVEGSYDNIKITTPEDIFVGERILQKQDK